MRTIVKVDDPWRSKDILKFVQENLGCFVLSKEQEKLLTELDGRGKKSV